MELHPHDMAHGGEAVARHDGKAYFIPGAMPGEVVEATVVEDKGSWARTALVEIIASSPERRDPPCPHAEACGGCQWQFATEQEQRRWKRSTVVGQLSHLGKLVDPLVHETVVPGSDLGYRNRMDFHIVDGRPALYRSRSNDLVPLDQCLLMVPQLQNLFTRLGDLSGVEKLTLRSGTETGDLVAIIDGTVPEQAESWGAAIVHREGNRLEPILGDGDLTEIVDGVTFRVPPDGFFQNNTPGAEALVHLVRDALEIEEGDTLLDGYCGVGLFGATLGREAARVVGLDSTRSAVDYARQNLGAAGVDHRLITGSFTKDIEKIDEYWDVAVVDPPRKGLGLRGIEAVTAAMPRRIAYVACDPASLARDTRTLAEFGYDFVEATPVDLFPQTYHIEIVARFDRGAIEDDDE
ncbi:MAG: methyltransferase [Proteobacteria bacterium]|nr:methyltransferase [Pseudomonadota bacterium]